MKDQFDHLYKIARKLKDRVIGKTLDVDLDNWIAQNNANKNLYNQLSDVKHQLKKLELYEQFDSEKAFKKIQPKLIADVVPLTKRILRTTAVLIPILIASYFIFQNINDDHSLELAQIDQVVSPGKQTAILTLSDGREIELDGSETNDKIYDRDMLISNVKNALQYAITGQSNQQKKQLNTLRTPKGGTYRVILSDGTKVWLNANSSIQYPVFFNDSIRFIQIIGEAFFDVVHNGKPFIVESSSTEIRVMGTSFNVYDFAGETTVRTTLVTGKIGIRSVITGNQVPVKILQPNQQAVLNTTTNKMKFIEVSTDQFTSWIKGKFEFNNESLEAVFVRLSRWYNFEYEFKNDKAKNQHFTGRIGNQQPVSSILQMLELTSDVKFKIEQSKIVIQ